MSDHHNRALEAIDAGLSQMFAEARNVRANFTTDVLRRVQHERWRREVFLSRVLYGGVCAAGILIISGAAVALDVLTAG
jgi:hypothetical protein